MRGSEALEVIIKVREINEIQRGTKFAFDPFGRFSNPTRDGIGRALGSVHAGGGTPETWERKIAEVAFDFFAHGIGPGVYVENLAAIRGINGPGCEGSICG